MPSLATLLLPVAAMTASPDASPTARHALRSAERQRRRRTGAPRIPLACRPLGAPEVFRRTRSLEQRFGERFEPSSSTWRRHGVDMARNGKRFDG